MIDEQHLTAEVAPITPEQDLPSLMARLEAIDEETAEPLGKLYTLMDEQSQEDKDAFGTAMEERSQQLEELPSDHEGIILGIDILRETGSPEIKEALEESATILCSLLSEAAMLERAAEPLANREFHETRNQFIKEARWDSIFMKSVSDGEYDDLRNLLGICSSELGSTSLDLHRAQALTDKIRDWRQKFTIQGDLLPEGEEQQLPEGWLPTVELENAIKDWEQSNADALVYLSDSRQAFARDTLPRPQFSKLSNLRYGIYLRDDPQGDNVPTEIAYGFERATELIMADFDRRDTEYLQASIQERPNTLFVGKQYLVRETTGIDDVNEWLQQRIARHPEALTKGLGFIYFEDGLNTKDESGDEVGAEGKGTWSTTGLMSEYENAIWVDVSKKIKEILIDGDPGSADLVEQYILGIVGETVDHELAHYAHKQRTPIAWLRKWHEATRAEQVNVTHYVENMNSDKPTNEGNPLLEDLAESSSLYLNEPGKLLVLGPMRFAAINERDKRYDSSYADWLYSTVKEDDYKNSQTMAMLDGMLQRNALDVIARQKAAPTTPIVSFMLDEV